MRKVILKGIIVVICAIALIWHAFQKIAIADGTYEVPIEYSKYSPDDAIDNICEARIVSLCPIGTEQLTYGPTTYATSGIVIANYYLVCLEDGTIGAVKMAAENEDLAGYDRWIVKSVEDLKSNKITSPLLLRGKTVTMPRFSYDFASLLSPDSSSMSAINSILSDITLLDATGTYPDTETIVPELPTLGGYTIFVVFAMVLFIIWIIWDIRRLKLAAQLSASYPQKSICENIGDSHADAGNAARAPGWQCSCGRINADYVMTCACGITKKEMKLRKQSESVTE